MEKIKIFVILSAWFAACNAYESCVSLDEMKTAIRSASKVVVKYKREFDEAVRFAALQDAIDAIDEAMLGYQGTANKHLSQLKRSNSDAKNTYEDCVSPVFQWCVTVNSTLNIFLDYINNLDLSKEGKLALWKVTYDALGDGMSITSHSLKLLHDVKKKTAETKNLLDDILRDMHTDFSPTGYYGKKKHELEEKKDNLPNRAVEVIKRVFMVIFVFVFGPIGIALGFSITFRTYGFDGDHSNAQRTAYEKQIEAINLFFNELDKKIRKAIEIAGQVQGELEQDETILNTVAGKMKGVNNNQGLVTFFGIEPLLPYIRQLGKSCEEYAISHGYWSKDYVKNHRRARRQASEDCYALRSKAKQVFIESTSINISNPKMISGIRSSFDEMDCESVKQFVPPQFDISQESLRLFGTPLLGRYFQSS